MVEERELYVLLPIRYSIRDAGMWRAGCSGGSYSSLMERMAGISTDGFLHDEKEERGLMEWGAEVRYSGRVMVGVLAPVINRLPGRRKLIKFSRLPSRNGFIAGAHAASVTSRERMNDT